MQMSDRIGRPIKLQDLHVLMAVVQAGSMNKAAALLNTRQSAIPDQSRNWNIPLACDCSTATPRASN
jgi:hypothetical protein